MPSPLLFWDRIRAFTRKNRLYQHEKIFQDQSSLDRIVAGGEFLDWNQQANVLDQTNLQINRLQRYKDYEQMDQTGEISLALDLYADEGSLMDPERKHTLVIRARSRRLKKELEDLFFNVLGWDDQNRPALRYLCKFGDCPYEIITNKNRDGVAALKHMNVYNFTRVETRYGDLVGFFFQDDIIPEPIFMHPWQVMHLRLTSLENIFAPYGRSIIDGGRKAFKQLRLMEDAALIYRITRAPEKRKFKIPVGMIPTKEVPEYMEIIARKFKRQRFYNPSTGSFDERYSPLIQEDDFFLPQRSDGVGPDIDVLPGAENLDAIADIEYFKKKMIAPLKIPFARVGIGQDAGKGSEKSLSASDPDFAKAVQWVQRAGVSGLTKVALVHLALRGYSVEDMHGFELSMSATSAIEELYRMETWATRVQVMGDLKELGWFPKEWIVTHFTDLTPDEILELKEMEEMASFDGDEDAIGGDEEEGGGLGGLGGGGADLGGMPALGGGEPEGDALGEEPEGGTLGEEPEGDALGDEEPGKGLGEHLGVHSSKKLITEIRKRNKQTKIMETLTKWAARRGKVFKKEELGFSSRCDFIIESKELDGLSRANLQDGGSADPNSRSNELIVEWSVPINERDSVIKETRALLMESISDDEVIEDYEVTANDLPA